jgi:hypothetical protein
VSGLVTASTPVFCAVRGVVAGLRDDVAEPKQRTVTTTGPIFAASTTLINETERRLRSKEHNRADWRSTLRYVRVTQCTPNCNVIRLRTPQSQLGTAFGTARLIWLSLSADDASLFWRVGPVVQETPQQNVSSMMKLDLTAGSVRESVGSRARPAQGTARCETRRSKYPSFFRANVRTSRPVPAKQRRYTHSVGSEPYPYPTAAGYLGMSVETLLRVYGHHHPDHLKDASPR